MSTQYRTGSIIPLGDGLTGKSVLTNFLIHDRLSKEERKKLLSDTLKSLNIEMEYSQVTKENAQTGDLLKAGLQFYVFPGQRQKISDVAPTFDEILEIFDFLPALSNLSVLLLIYDSSRLESLKSLESWLQVSMTKKWLSNDTLVILVANKIDQSPPDDNFLSQVKSGIQNIMISNDFEAASKNVQVQKISCLTYEGIDKLRETIHNWVLRD